MDIDKLRKEFFNDGPDNSTHNNKKNNNLKNLLKNNSSTNEWKSKTNINISTGTTTTTNVRNNNNIEHDDSTNINLKQKWNNSSWDNKNQNNSKNDNTKNKGGKMKYLVNSLKNKNSLNKLNDLNISSRLNRFNTINPINIKLSLNDPRLMESPNIIKRMKNMYKYNNISNNIINFVKANKNDMEKIRNTLFLKAYENSELLQLKKQNKKDKLSLKKNNEYIDIKDAREKQKSKLLKVLKSYNIKHDVYTNIINHYDYSIYYQDKSVLDELAKKQRCDNFFYYLVSKGFPYNEILRLSSVFENMAFLKNCNLCMLPWIYKKINEFHNFDFYTFLFYTLAYSVSTLTSSFSLFIKYKTIAIVIPLFITYVLLAFPFLLQELNCGRFFLDGCISYFYSICNFNLPIAVALIIQYILLIIKSIDTINLNFSYFFYYFMDQTPLVYKNIDKKFCSQFNRSPQICNFSRNICYYNEQTQNCEINDIKLGVKIYDRLIGKYVPPRKEMFETNTMLFSFFCLIIFNIFTKYKTSHNILKLFIFFIILYFVINTIFYYDFTLIKILLKSFTYSRTVSVLSNYEVWILCLLHCTTNMSLHSGIYFYTSKGL
ncbi:amino acid transporter, putative, partial [Hepatocystis sp. ex Piliocolobus tephrosceles]